MQKILKIHGSDFSNRNQLEPPEKKMKCQNSLFTLKVIEFGNFGIVRFFRQSLCTNIVKPVMPLL